MAYTPRPRVSLVLLAAILAVVCALVLAADKGSMALRRENQIAKMRLDLSALSERINRMVDLRTQAIRALAADPLVADYVASRGKSGARQVRQILNLAASMARPELIYLLDAQGTMLVHTAYPRSLVGINYAYRPYFKEAMQGREAIFPAMGAATKTRGLYLSAPVYGPDSKSPVGVAALKIGIREMDAALEETSGIKALMSPDGVILSSSDPDWLFKSVRPVGQDAEERLADTRQFGNRTIEPLGVDVADNAAVVGGRDCLVAKTPLDIPGWSLACFKPVNPIFPLSGRQRALVAGSLLVSVGLALLVAVLVDNIISRRRSEHALRVSEEKHRSIFENAIEGIFRTGRDGRLVSVNTSLARILDYTSASDLMSCVRDINTQIYHDRADPEALTKSILVSRETVSRECRLKSKHGKAIWCLVSAKAVRDEKGRILFFQGFVLDITERMQARKQLERMNMDLEQLVRERTTDLVSAYKELESFSYSVSHDLRAPLRTLDGFSQALMEDYAHRLDDTGMDYLSRVRRASRRMGELIDDLQHLAKVSSVGMKRKPFDISAMTREILAELRAEQPDRLVETNVQDGLFAVGDPDMIRLLLSNLLRNAWKFTAYEDRARIEFTAESASPTVYHVRDNGAGFDMNYAHKLFEAFNRLHSPEEFEGSGIGLSIVQRVVQRHEGEVWAQGEVGRGAVFSFTLGDQRPVAVDAAPQS